MIDFEKLATIIQQGGPAMLALVFGFLYFVERRARIAAEAAREGYFKSTVSAIYALRDWAQGVKAPVIDSILPTPPAPEVK